MGLGSGDGADVDNDDGRRGPHLDTVYFCLKALVRVYIASSFWQLGCMYRVTLWFLPCMSLAPCDGRC